MANVIMAKIFMAKILWQMKLSQIEYLIDFLAELETFYFRNDLYSFR